MSCGARTFWSTLSMIFSTAAGCCYHQHAACGGGEGPAVNVVEAMSVDARLSRSKYAELAPVGVDFSFLFVPFDKVHPIVQSSVHILRVIITSPGIVLEDSPHLDR